MGLIWCPHASATYSLILIDVATKQMGAAAASCVPVDISSSYGAATGRGVVLAQAQMSDQGKQRAIELLTAGAPVQAIMEALAAPAFDRDASLRQYGVVDITGNGAVYTGSANSVWAGGRHGRIGTLAYAVQGNFLTSERVVTQIETALRRSKSSFSDRLMESIEAASANNEGDARCSRYGIPATAALMHVENGDGTVALHLSVLIRTGESAIQRLRRDYEAQRPTRTLNRPPTQHALVSSHVREWALAVGAVLLCLVGALFWRRRHRAQ